MQPVQGVTCQYTFGIFMFTASRGDAIKEKNYNNTNIFLIENYSSYSNIHNIINNNYILFIYEHRDSFKC